MGKRRSVVERLLVGITNSFRVHVSLRAVRTSTRLFAFGVRVVSPSDDLRHRTDFLYFGGFNFPRNDHLEPFGLFGVENDPNSFGGRQHLMILIVVSSHHRLFVRDAEVNTGNCPLTTSFELAEPLMRNIEIVGHRHSEHDPVVAVGQRLFKSARLDTDPTYRVGLFLCCEMNE